MRFQRTHTDTQTHSNTVTLGFSTRFQIPCSFPCGMNPRRGEELTHLHTLLLGRSLAEYRSPNLLLLVPPLLRLGFVGVLISVPVALVIKRAGYTHTEARGSPWLAEGSVYYYWANIARNIGRYFGLGSPWANFAPACVEGDICCQGEVNIAHAAVDQEASQWRS